MIKIEYSKRKVQKKMKNKNYKFRRKVKMSKIPMLFIKSIRGSCRHAWSLSLPNVDGVGSADPNLMPSLKIR